MDEQRLGQELLDPHAGVQGCVRILEDDLHVASQPPQLALVAGAYIATVELDLTGGRLDQTQDAARERGLATA